MTVETLEQQRSRIDAIVEGKTILDFFDRNAEAHSSKAALHWKDGDTWKSLTWKEYRDSAHRAAAGLLSLGFGGGDFVGIQAGNRPEHVIADMAAIAAGGTAVTIYSTLQAEQVRYIANDCSAKVAVLENLDFMKRWEEIWSSLPNLSHIVLMEGAENYETDERVLSWDDLLERGDQHLAGDGGALDRVREGITPDSLATLIYTSGTTGTPKGVMISQRNVVWTCVSTLDTLHVSPNPRAVSYLPLAHIAERVATHYGGGIYLGGEIYYCPDMSEVVEYVQKAQPTLFVGVPRVYEKFHAALMARFADDSKKALIMRAIDNGIARVDAEQAGKSPSFMVRVQDALFDRLVFSKIRDGLGMGELEVAISAAAPISRDLVMFFNAIGIPLFNLWGLSENTGPATTNRADANRIGSVGKPLNGVEVEIADDGEIKLRGGIVTGGYYNLPEQTAESFQDGWLYTGDLGRVDEDGFVWITGRKKDIIITAAGKNIAPAKLETAVKSNALIGEVCMVGDERKFLTMLVALDPDTAPGWAAAHGIEYSDMASFAAHPEVHAEVERIIEAANQHVSQVEQVKKFFIAPEAWGPDTGEITPSLKLKRRVVLDKYSSDIDAMYAE